jgi:pyruvate/2-oxoglutarate dehydrogenase complex dihydrolipoamide dehydrogenase (E3) component
MTTSASTAVDYDGAPRITYSDPEVASVGITSAVAAARGIKTVEVDYPLGANGRSVILRTQGAAKVIATAPANCDGSPGPCSASTWSARAWAN